MDKGQTTMIYSTDTGIIALDSPVKLKILELLKKGTMSFDELVECSGKAKSTISVHLDDLEELNLILEKKSPEDRRKKFFALNSVCLACSEKPMRDQYHKHLENMVTESDGDSFINHIFFTIRYGMEAYGFNPKPIMKQLGNDIGSKIGEAFESDDSEGVLNELSAFWKEHNLGDMKIMNSRKPAIVVINCYHCGKMPNVGKTLCSMDEGIIEGIFSTRLKIDCNVRETECFGTGHKHCKFVVEEK